MEFERLRLRGLCFGGKLCADESKAVYNFILFFWRGCPVFLCLLWFSVFFCVFRGWNGECSVLMNAPSSLYDCPVLVFMERKGWHHGKLQEKFGGLI